MSNYKYPDKMIDDLIKKEERQMKKIYSCCICHKQLEEKPIRLTKQIYGTGRYQQYSPIAHYDFCKECYRKFDSWIKKHKKGD